MFSKNEIDLDLILNQVGSFGKYQIFNYILLCLPAFFFGAAALSFAFTAGNIDYRCYVAECEQSPPIYNVPWFTNAIPQRNSGSSSKCTHYVLARNVSNHEECNSSTDIFDNSIEITCNQYVYETNELTLVNEFDLHCDDNEWKLALVGTINNIGLLIFIPFSGFLSDRYGRKKILIIALMCKATFGLIRSFAINYYMFVIAEFLEAGLGSITFTAVFILGTEVLSPSRRVLGGIIITVAFSLGLGVTAVIAMLTKNFRTTLRIIYCPIFLFITYIWLIPESMRWLMVKRKYQEVLDILLKIVSMNKIKISDDLLRPLREQEAAVVEHANPTLFVVDATSQITTDGELKIQNGDKLLTVFKTPFLMIRLLNCSFCWFTNTFVYYGLSLNSVSLGGDKYVNFMLACFIEIPGTILCYFILDRFGRKWSLSLALILSGIACLVMQIEIQNSAISLILFLIGKCAISFSFTALYIYTVELYPTNLRHTLVTICSMVGRVGSALAPLTPLLGNVMTQLPFILFGGIAILSGLLVLQFPETLNKKLPDTLEEARFIS